jgi:hypothetical protein
MARIIAARGLRRLAHIGAVLVATLSAVVLVAPGTANAAGCTIKAGTTSNLALGPNGLHPTGGTIFTKGSICLDLNLTKVGAKDGYEGVLERSDGTWFICGGGFHTISPGDGLKVLCTNVLAGTNMAVAQKSGTRRNITAEY